MMNGILITVRTGSTRLPNKALLEIEGKSTIEHLINRVKHSKLADKIVLCTTTLEDDNILCEIAEKSGIDYYRGSVEDKLERWLGACNKFNIDFFVTADGDDLFCEPKLIDLALKQRKISQEDFIKSDNTICGAFTYGISKNALDKVCSIKDSEDTEMMWTYFEDTGLFNISELNNVPSKYIRDDIRMTLDYHDDFIFFENIIKNFGNKYFSLTDIVDYIDLNPEVAKINLYLEKEWKKNQVKHTTLSLKKDINILPCHKNLLY
jgi:spore coat polysaccharide biosynthesis protein SpsF